MQSAAERTPVDIAKGTVQELYARVLGEFQSAWRFRWYGAALAWAAFLAGWVYVASQPNIYEANARFFVDTSSVLRPVLQDQIVVPVDLGAQLGFVRQSLLGRENLEHVARVNGLGVNASSEADLDRALNNLRLGISISNRDRNNPGVFSISYRDSDRRRAINVVQTLLDYLVQTTIGAKDESSETASRFLDERIAEYERRLEQAEESLADFKKRNADRLPGAQGGYFERMREVRNALEAAEQALQLVESRREQLVMQLESETPIMPSGSGLAEPPPNSIDARIRDRRAELDALLLRFTERHPDVVNLRETLTRLEAQRAEQLRQLGVSDVGQEVTGLDTNPIYQALRISLNETDVEIAARRAEVQTRRDQLAQLQAAIDEVPDVEAELTRLNRDYSVIYDQYNGMVQSRETQELSRKAFDEDNVDFRVLDPPLAAFEPVAPDRRLLLVGAFVAALGMGAAVCWLLAQLNPVFHNAAALRRVSGMPVIGTVTLATPDRQRLRRRMGLFAFAAAIGGLATVFAGAVLVEVHGSGLFSLVGLD